MKEPMKKLTVLSFYKDKDEVTQQLQILGMIHPEEGKKIDSDNIESLEDQRIQIQKAIDYIDTFSVTGNTGAKGIPDKTITDIVTDIQHLRHKLDENIKNQESLEKEMPRAKIWGDFNRKKIRILKNQGIVLRYFIAKNKYYKRFDFSAISHFVIHEENGKIYFVVISYKDEAYNLPFEQRKLPKFLPSEIISQQKKLRSEEETLIRKLQKRTVYIPALKNELLTIHNLIEFQKVSHSFSSSENGKIMVIKGWYPEKIEKELLKSLEKLKITFFLSEPTQSDQVPIQLYNNRYSRIFEPVTRIFQLPNYHEFDLTPMIAVFYPIFFAYCLGDAGYGLVLVLISVAGGMTFLKNSKKIAVFGALLGGFTAVMGIVKSGNVFGIPLSNTSEVPLFQFLAQYVLIPDNQNFMFNAFNVALMIGVVQILVGVITSVFKKIVYQSFTHSISQIGKFMIICGILLIFLADMQNIQELKPYLPLARIALFSGIALVLLFHDLSLSILKRIGSGLLPLFFIFTGILGDVLSYVRLFALGVVSSVLGLVVNQIGMQIIPNGWWGIILGIAFMLFGHSLNLALAVLGAVVHPLRLTFVEFYNNAQFEGGGIEYKPFRHVTNTNNYKFKS